MGRRLRYLPYEKTLVEVTNRIIHGRMLLRSTKKFRAIILGALGRAQRRYDVEIHAFVFLGNHYHLLISVRDAKQMAAFVGYFEAKIAKEVARMTNWRTKIWARPYVAIPVSQEEAAQVGRLKYLLSNGVKENLVSRPSEWTGAHSVSALLEGKPLEGVWNDRTAEYRARLRGKSFLLNDFAHRESIELTPLPCWAELPEETLRDTVRALVDQVIAEAPSRASLNRKLLRGPEPTDRPRHSKRSPAPWFHCASKVVRQELMRAYAGFLAAYREAANRLKDGELTAPFPDGCFPPPRPFVAAS